MQYLFLAHLALREDGNIRAHGGDAYITTSHFFFRGITRVVGNSFVRVFVCVYVVMLVYIYSVARLQRVCRAVLYVFVCVFFFSNNGLRTWFNNTHQEKFLSLSIYRNYHINLSVLCSFQLNKLRFLLYRTRVQSSSSYYAPFSCASFLQ